MAVKINKAVISVQHQRSELLKWDFFFSIWLFESAFYVQVLLLSQPSILVNPYANLLQEYLQIIH